MATSDVMNAVSSDLPTHFLQPVTIERINQDRDKRGLSRSYDHEYTTMEGRRKRVVVLKSTVCRLCETIQRKTKITVWF